MQQPSPETSFEKSRNAARKGSTESASNAASSAFAASSNLSFNTQDSVVPPDQKGRRRLTDSYFIPRSMITPDPNQPRQEFNELEMLELAASIKERGIKQPLTVRWNPTSEKYMVIDGGRRYEAAFRLKLEELPCWVQQGDRKEVLIDQIVHNWQRADLRPYETADALARLRDEFGMAQVDLCRVTGKPKSEISKLLALHDKVDPEIQHAARSDKDTVLTKRHLYNISKLNREEQRDVARQVQRQKLNALETEALVNSNNPRAQGVAARQRRFKTTDAEVLMTFRRKPVTTEHVRKVLADLQRQLAESVV